VLKKRLTGWALAIMLVAQFLVVFPAAASDRIIWSEAKTGTYDPIHPYTLNWTGDVLDRGGLNLSTMKQTGSKDADIVINQYGSIGANGILLLDEKLEDSTDADIGGFGNSVTMQKGGVYLIVRHDGTFAKIRIDRYLPDNGQSITKVFFTYVLEEDRQTSGGGTPASEPGGTPSNAAGFDYDPVYDAKNPAATYEFEEGAITLPWNAASGQTSWDIYRSDNGQPYVKMTDFRLTEPSFTDNYIFAGHTYVYRVVAYNSREQQVSVTPPLKVTILKKGNTSTPAPSPAPAAETVIILQINNKVAKVNGKNYTLDAAPFVHNGRTVVPLRFVSEALGAKVSWNGKEQSITLKRGTETIVLYLGKSEALINGKKVMMDVPAFQLKGNTFVPIRFVSVQLNQDIQFDNKTQTITIKPKPSATGGKPADSASGSQSKPATNNAQKPSDNSNGSQKPSDNGNGSQKPSDNGNGSQKPSDNATAGGSSDYFIGQWAMWIPGTGVSSNGGGKYIPGVDAGTLTIYKDGTYTYVWNGKLITQTWEKTINADQITLNNYKFESSWVLTKTKDGVRASTYPSIVEDGTRIK